MGMIYQHIETLIIHHIYGNNFHFYCLFQVERKQQQYQNWDIPILFLIYIQFIRMLSSPATERKKRNSINFHIPLCLDHLKRKQNRKKIFKGNEKNDKARKKKTKKNIKIKIEKQFRRRIKVTENTEIYFNLCHV